ncbi:hypothetical protein BpHYR1_053332 [Brachionus plicatilis]|uniref:Uncharacterized protein n=1 Tax=Brachionus plicatilis TaxID=10195 RepID=A0A3M7QNC3_BRAPC|nr:hypothetical protein BpHYR1_053332 [Brachionus plicatilis]
MKQSETTVVSPSSVVCKICANKFRFIFNTFKYGAILQNSHRFCRLLQKVKQQLFHFVSFTEQFCMKFHNVQLSYFLNKYCHNIIKSILLVQIQEKNPIKYCFDKY